ncbi:hypothetical protein COS83_03580 [archaeon CG07_land_8_20_14_0_80_38_8]|nr:MAG: hypothetical protein COS83_03580 [archaeon CG07_land_8_20_14_0_80_38_8]PIU89547.1 MAG: hypothetical protein COS64_00480 [archaeon CG06_land_8_20_14_3_00_37_11]
MKIKIKFDNYAIIFLLILIGSILIRFIDLSAVGYVTDEPVIITAGIKHFLNNPYPVSLYDMATPGGQWPIGLSVTLLSGRDFSIIKDYSMMDYASIDLNNNLLKGLEFAARLPGAIMGVISGIIVFLLVKELYGKKAGLISYAMFSFSPILIDYSRIALLEIYQITYMLIALYFLYLSVARKEKNNTYLILAGIFTGLTAAAKLNGLMLIPLFALFTIVSQFKIKKKNNELQINLIGFLKNAGIIILTSTIILLIVFNFNINTPLTVYNYYSQTSGATGLQFVLFQLIYDSLFFFNPLTWILLIAALYLLIKDLGKIEKNDLFCLFLILLIIISGFFDTHSTIKRGIQFMCLIFIIISKLFSQKKFIISRKYWAIIPILIIIMNLGLVLYYFPNTGLAKSVICTNQECLDAHNTRNYDARIVGEYFNNLDNAVIYDTVSTTGLTAFYLNKEGNYYLTGGIAKLQLNNTCPNYQILKNVGFNYVIDNGGCFAEISKNLENCTYENIYIKNYEMVKIYNITNC